MGAQVSVLLAIAKFFLSPVGRYVAIGLAALAIVGGAYWKGDSNGAARVQGRWDAAREAARIEKVRLDNEAAERAATTDSKNTAAEAASDQSTIEARDAYIKRLEAGVCTLDADSLDRLQNIK